MKYFKAAIIFLTIITIRAFPQDPDPSFLDALTDQLIRKDNIIQNRFPEYTRDGQWEFRDKVNWLSGFLGGELWYGWDITGKNELRERALQHAENLMAYIGIDNTHDMGFIFLPTLVASYEHTGEKRFATAALKAAGMLAERYNKAGRFIRAWGKLGSTDRAGWMIIDTMMNLELLFWASEYSGDISYYDLAYSHAITEMKQGVRGNGSSFHVVQFDPETGQVLKKGTHQGYSDSSTWARGQAWGIYGFANAYRRTGDQRFLSTSCLMADYFLAHIPDDMVPCWDLDLKDPATLRDASAAAIAASGLFLLSEQLTDRQEIENYRTAAINITRSLIKNYSYISGNHAVEQGLLAHTIYHFHKEWGVDESFPAGDFYFMEAVFKYRTYLNKRQAGNDSNDRKMINLDKNWYYLEDGVEEIEQLALSPVKWTRVDLPHTWNQWDATDITPGYRRDAGWYQKDVFIPAFSKEPGRIILYFECANISAVVYINQKLAGSHTGGYVGFEIDVTDLLKFGQDNNILVRVDNSYDPYIIPSQKSDFFIYGGLTRDVWLKIVPAAHIEKISIKTPSVSAEKAVTTAEIALSGISDAAQYSIDAVISDPAGQKIAETQITDVQKSASVTFETVKNPLLWSPDHPNLHTLTIRLMKGERVVDSLEERFGYRWYEFREHGPFFLNGKRLLLRGTHRHEECAGYGAAMPDSLHRRDMRMIKEMGANFVRLAHYPQDPEIYKACDELGILVWDELPWCRGGVGPVAWQKNTKNFLSEMIRQNMNHPSIIIWSLGNEVYWLPDFPGGDNIDSLRSYLSSLNTIAHKMDPGRVTAIRKFYEGADIVDLFSPSIWAGWYSGVYTNYEKAVREAKDKYKHFFHAEYGGSSQIGRHIENPVDGKGIINPEGWEEAVNQVRVKNIAQNGNWSENYIVDLFDWHLHISENLDWFTGNAQWAFKDFGTPLRPENAIPYVNQKGLTDRAGNPKDAYYVFKSYWTKDPVFCYIESHTWTQRAGPSDTPRQVCVYSNADAVELQINGTGLGRLNRDPKTFPAQGLHWPVSFKEGTNTLIASGFSGNEPVASDTIIVSYAYKKNGKPEIIELQAARMTSGNYLIEAIVRDGDGNRCLDYQDRIYFSADGPGQLVTNWGTPTRSQIIECANGRAAIEFHAIPDGRAVIEARNQDFKGSYLVLDGREQ